MALACELLHIPLKVLRRELVERADVGALEHGPETLNAVRVGLSPNILGHAMLDRFVVRKSLIGDHFARVDRGVRSRMLNHEAL